MFIFPKISVIFLASIFTSALGLSVSEKRQDLSAQTTFDSYYGCSADDKKIIEQAHEDALTLANSAIENCRELLSTSNPGGKCIDWNTQAATDYWGPPSQSSPYQQQIFNTLYRATQTSRGIGWSDFWKNRFVSVYCTDKYKACTPNATAYTNTSPSLTYPVIVYCPNFFKKLESHGELVARIKADKSGQMKKNLRNLRSRATTALHEWLHIKKFSAEVCAGGCVDTLQMIGGGELLPTYKAGLTKLLARRDPAKASQTNDNYAYFAMSLFMEKTFGVYPQYPTAWDPTKTKKENEAIEAGQPGAPSSIQSWEMADDDEIDESLPTATGSPLPATVYPSWYQPLIKAGATTSLPSISAPAETQPPMGEPDSNNVICVTTDSSPKIEDCIHAFGSINQYPNEAAEQGKKGKSWWAGYVDTCALTIQYKEDWTSACNATLLDVQGHASAIFEGCLNDGKGTVAGQVPFAVPNCPADITILHTKGAPPSST